MTKRLVLLLCLGLAACLVSSQAYGATLDLRLSSGGDDAEEHLDSGSMDITSSDLEFPYEDNADPQATDPQLNALRFILPIPKGAQIFKAYLEFEQDETKGNDKPVNVVIEAQLVPNAPAITSAAMNLSSRTPWTTAKVKWEVPMGGKNDQKFQSPDLTAVLTEIISQEGWAADNAVLLAIRDDADNPSKGLRCMESVDGEATAAPLLHIEVSIPMATKPEPADGALAVTTPLFQWTAGDGAIAHQVYLGTTPDLGAGDAAGGLTPMPMYFHVAGLTPGTTYYWRVDETAADGTVTTGDVWKFQAEPIVAWAPSPAADATGLLPTQMLTWRPGTGAAQHQVFLSSKRADVVAGAAAADKGMTADTMLATGLLATGTTYYWRVDEIDGAGTVNKGDLWSFTTADAHSHKIVWEKWLNIGSGVLVSDLTSNPAYPDNPSEVELLDSFQSAVDWADNYGQRLYGWLTPPESGDYTFWVAGDDAQELWLSTDEDPANAVLIASVSGWTPALDFDNTGGGQGGTNQKSAPVKLEANKKYYIMALGKEGGGGDSTAVAWQGPGIATREVISAQYIDTNAQGYFAIPPEATSSAPTIIWVSDAYDDKPDGVRDDQGWIDFLTAQGFNVDYQMGPALGDGYWRTLDDAKIAALNAADLVIFSRNSNSGSYNDGNERDQWNGLTVPLISMAMHPLRSSHWKWFNTTTINTAVPLMQPVDPANPIFTGVTLDANGQIEALGPTLGSSFPGVMDAGNGTVLATRADTGEVWIAMWPAGTEFYAGSGQMAAGPRVFFAGAMQETAPTIGRGEFNLTDSGQAVFLNVIDLLLGRLPAQVCYTYEGDTAAAGAGETTEAGTSLDGTWSNENGSDAWDGTAPGAGIAGGAGVFVEDDVTFLRIQDTGDPRDYGNSDPSNRKVYFQHPITSGLDGAHLEICMRVATTGVLDPVNPDGGAGITPWPAAGIGMHIRDDGKGMFGVAEAGVGIISFSLAKAGEIAGLETDALVMNNLVDTSASANVDTGEAATAANAMVLADATQWNTIVIDIAAGGAGTHVVTVSVNGGTPQSFDVTAGTGVQGTVSYIALGSSGTGPATAFDVDYVSICE